MTVKKPKKKKLGTSSIALMETNVSRGKGKKREKHKKVDKEKVEDDTGNKNASLLDYAVMDILKEMSHPTKLQYWNLNRTYSMQEIIRQKIKILSEKKNPDDYELQRYLKLFNDYGKEIRHQSKELIEVWDSIEKRTHDMEKLKIFKNIKAFVEFLADNGEFELLKEFQQKIYNKGYKVEDDD